MVDAVLQGTHSFLYTATEMDIVVRFCVVCVADAVVHVFGGLKYIYIYIYMCVCVFVCVVGTVQYMYVYLSYVI